MQPTQVRPLDPTNHSHDTQGSFVSTLQVSGTLLSLYLGTNLKNIPRLVPVQTELRDSLGLSLSKPRAYMSSFPKCHSYSQLNPGHGTNVIALCSLYYFHHHQ